jgi:hypothetical protein
VGPDEWVDAFLFAGYYQQTWLGLGQVFSDYINKHNTDATNALIAAYQNADGPGNDNGFAVYTAVQCTDIQGPTEWSVFLLAEPGGTTHADSLFGNLCVDSTIANYLTTGALPPRKHDALWDATCAPLPVPVPPGASSGASSSSQSASVRAFSRAANRLGLPAVELR